MGWIIILIGIAIVVLAFKASIEKEIKQDIFNRKYRLGLNPENIDEWKKGVDELAIIVGLDANGRKYSECENNAYYLANWEGETAWTYVKTQLSESE